jgi:hypothetical protein
MRIVAGLLIQAWPGDLMEREENAVPMHGVPRSSEIWQPPLGAEEILGFRGHGAVIPFPLCCKSLQSGR